MTFPTGWNRGWMGEWRIGGGGTEVPCLKNGRWYLRVFNWKTKQHGIYDFSTDMIEMEQKS